MPKIKIFGNCFLVSLQLILSDRRAEYFEQVYACHHANETVAFKRIHKTKERYLVEGIFSTKQAAEYFIDSLAEYSVERIALKNETEQNSFEAEHC
jgi:hypothetical protein